ncbi:MAG: hypothetical protein M5U34_43965 [Chloroflexi bacterium]|nr:hypothetical protein [Chloroflexota bacterium]
MNGKGGQGQERAARTAVSSSPYQRHTNTASSGTSTSEAIKLGSRAAHSTAPYSG